MIRPRVQVVILFLLLGGISCGIKLGHDQQQRSSSSINGDYNTSKQEQKSVINEIWPWIVLVSVVFVGQIGLIWINWVTRYSKEKEKYENKIT